MNTFIVSRLKVRILKVERDVINDVPKLLFCIKRLKAKIKIKFPPQSLIEKKTTRKRFFVHYFEM